MRRIISVIILLSLMIHTSGRLGLISYVYTHRHDIAYAIGFAGEKVIAVCSGAYFQQTGILLVHDDHSSESAGLIQAQEIKLINPSAFSFDFTVYNFPMRVSAGRDQMIPYQVSLTDIFRPPIIFC